MVAFGQLPEHPADVAPLDEASADEVLRLFEKGDGENVLRALFAGLQIDGGTVGLVAQQGGPVLRHEDAVHLVGRVADGVEAADDAAHAGAHDDVDGDAGLFHNPQCADVRRAFGAPAAQHYAHFGTGRKRRQEATCDE